MNLKHQKLIITKTLSLVIVLFVGTSFVYAQTTNGTGVGGAGGVLATYIGYEAGQSTTGANNTFVGGRAGKLNTIGKSNTFLGVNAGLNHLRGDRNTFLGLAAGQNNTLGAGNVFVGYAAGQNETGSNKLFIDNTSTNSPLIYGDFQNNYVVINGGGATVALVPDASAYGLYVTKGILTEKVKVATVNSGDWMDRVFEEDYDLNTIEEVEGFIEENGHLPNVPSAVEVSKNGVDMVEMDATLLRQIEELWLHTIKLNERIQELEAQLDK